MYLLRPKFIFPPNAIVDVDVLESVSPVVSSTVIASKDPFEWFIFKSVFANSPFASGRMKFEDGVITSMRLEQLERNNNVKNINFNL